MLKAPVGSFLKATGLFVYGNIFYAPPGDRWMFGNGVIGTWTGDNFSNV